MRLTLRYLLAYLDDQLEPADAQEMSERIEASSFATDLMHRVRDVSRRLKLGAPKISARGLAGDPNTVAEYLDHTMPADQVPEFEKICLTSDVHLAEVASAHQILALVLGERVEVDPKLRRRMYEIPEHEQALERQKSETEGEEIDDEPVPVGPRKRRRPEIPEWLREKPQRNIPWVPLTLAAALLITGTVVTYVFMHVPPRVASEVEVADSGANSVAPPAAPEANGDEDKATVADAAAITEEPGEPAGSGTEVGSESAPPSDVAAAGIPAADLPPENSAPVAPAEEDVATRPASPLRPASTDESAFDTDIPPAGDVAAMPAEPRTALSDPALLPENERPQEGESNASGAVAVGRLVNDSELLLHGAGGAGDWQRLSVRDPLLSDDELFALPTFRPGVALSTGGGAIAHLLGGSVVRLTSPDPNGVPGLQIIDGQVVVATAGKPGTQLNLQVNDQLYTVTFLGPDARIAIDVRRWLPDGADPMEVAAQSTADLYVPNGEIEYQSTGATSAITLKAPAMRTLIAKQGPDPGDATNEAVFPPWINGNPLSQVEKWAADAVSKELLVDDPTGQPLLAHLRELAQNRRVEVRNLAVQCLTLLGDFEGLLPLLNDEKQRTNWPHQIEAARRAMDRSPQVAKQLQETLEGQRDPVKAKELYEMLRGYSKRQLQDGAAARLVADLDHEDLDFRVLAFWNLQRVAVGTLGYKPEYAPAKRQNAVRAWKQRLADGQIVPK
ncbi:MAG TPA: hypothetical protein VHD36_07685 [Pirellulales bacterium]|nr:hypothetical protein [Pirellulales bacterium]